MPAPPGHLLMLVALTGLMFEALARTGTGPRRWLRGRPAGPAEAFGTAALLGLATTGTVLLGLGLLGLFRPPVLWASAILLVAAGEGRSASPLLRTLGAAGRPRAAWLPAAVALAFVGHGLLLPRLDQDSLLYHLGVPWHALREGRLLFDHVPFAFHLPLPVDLVSAWALLLGGDRLAAWLMAGAFAAGCAAVGGRGGGGLATLLVLALTPVPWLLTIAKNDPAAAALLVAGAWAWRDRDQRTGAVLMGAGVAAKLSLAPLALAWLAFHPPRRRNVLALAALTAAPLLPWLVKAWLLTGDPVFPHGDRVFASFLWGPANRATYAALRLWIEDAARPAGFLLTLAETGPVIALAGAVLLASPSRRAAAAALVGAWLTLIGGGIGRYMLPALWLLAALAGREVARLPRRPRRWAVGVLTLLALLALGRNPEVRARFAPDVDRGRPPDAYEEACAALPGSGRVLTVGEEHTYPLPARPVYGGFIGETPLVWRLVTASHTPAELRKRFRQTGATRLWYNVVGIERVIATHDAFAWTPRALGLYRTFCLSYLEVRRPPPFVDHRGGGIWWFDLRSRPALRPARWAIVLPGTETALHAARVARDRHQWDDALRGFAAFEALVPGIGYTAGQVGATYREMGDWSHAAATLRPWVARGLLDGVTLPVFGEAAIYSGALDEAERTLRACLTLYPDTAPAHRVNLAWSLHQRAERALRAGDRTASRLLQDAEAMLALVPVEPGLYYSHARTEVAALLAALREKNGR